MSDQTPPAGSSWKKREVTGAEVHITSPEGDATTIKVVYDPDNQPTEEELKQTAWQMHHDAKRIRERITTEETETLAEDLRTGEYGKWFARELRAALSSSTVAATAGDDDTPEEIAESEAAASEFNAIMREKGDKLADAILDAYAFWRNVAHDALTHAYAWALEDLRKARPDLHDRPDDEFSDAWTTRYQEGGYLAEAILNIMPSWTEILTKGLVDADGGLGPLAELIEGKARERVQDRRIGGTQHPIMRPMFTDGYGHSPSDGIANGARGALLGSWLSREDGFPMFTHRWGEDNGRGRGVAWYSPDGAMFPTPEDAMKAIERYSDGHVNAFEYVTGKWLANRDKESRGPFDGVYISAEEFLDDRGISRHKHGYHKPENLEEVTKQVEDLTQILVSGTVEAPKKRGRSGDIRIEAPLAIISQYVRKPRLDGTTHTIGWYIRPGDWAATMQDLSPQFAVTTQALFRLETKRHYLTIRTGRYLLSQFRIRSYHDTYRQPFRIETILEGARITIGTTERKNPGRFRERIEAALDSLKTLEQPVIKSWRYLDKVPETGRGMLERWQQARIVCVPADDLTTKYGELNTKGKGTRALIRKRVK